MQQLENFLELIRRTGNVIYSNNVAASFSTAILIVLLLSGIGRLQQSSRVLQNLERSGTTLLTTLGVLGTFTGIFIGLLDFDVTSIGKSVPALLDGLRIAFVTSIVGIAAAILLKIWQALIPPSRASEVEITPGDIHQSLASIKSSIEHASAVEKQALEDVKNEFHQFAETMTENNSKALIAALEGIIRDFNTQLNEQFGDNFRQLNEAVAALLTWQTNYREHVEELEERIETTVSALEQANQVLKQVSDHTGKIPEMLEPLKGLLSGMQAGIAELESGLGALASLKVDAENALPLIEENLGSLTDGLRKSVERLIADTSQSAELQEEALNKLSHGYEKLLASSTAANEKFDRSLADILSRIETKSQESLTKIDLARDETRKLLDQRMIDFDQEMQKELSKALALMGRHLASLSEKFVEDYGPITEHLRETIRMIESARGTA